MALLTNQTTDTTGTGAQLTGSCSVLVYGTFDGAQVVLEAADSDTESHYQPLSWITALQSPGWVKVDLDGTYYLRAKQSRSGASTSITVVANQ